jgi:hypothetical protein
MHTYIHTYTQVRKGGLMRRRNQAEGGNKHTKRKKSDGDDADASSMDTDNGNDDEDMHKRPGWRFDEAMKRKG